MAIISFDFDDTLVTRMQPKRPGDLLHRVGLERPVRLVLDALRSTHAAGHVAVIVTARTKPLHPWRKSPPTIRWWLRQWALPLNVYYTDGRLKGPLLRKLGAKMHWDDNAAQLQSAREHGIAVVEVTTADLFT